MNRFLIKNKWLVLTIAAFVLVGLKFVVDRDPTTLSATDTHDELATPDRPSSEHGKGDIVVPGVPGDESAESAPPPPDDADGGDEGFVDDDGLVDNTSGFDPNPDDGSSSNGDEPRPGPPLPPDDGESDGE